MSGETYNSHIRQLNQQILALRSEVAALQTDASWQQRESERAIAAFQNANDTLADENADLTDQLAVAQSVIDGQAYRIQQLEQDARALAAMLNHAVDDMTGVARHAN